jgi:hypothetical protein
MVAQTRVPPGFGIVHVTLESVIMSCDEAYASFLGVRPQGGCRTPHRRIHDRGCRYRRP